MRFKNPSRLVDYFVVAGHGDTFTPLDPKSARKEPNYLKWVFMPNLIDQFPFTEYKDTPFPPNSSMFCIPEGVTISEVSGFPTFFTCVLTGGDGARIFAACLTFYEALQPEDRFRLAAVLEDHLGARVIDPNVRSSVICTIPGADVDGEGETTAGTTSGDVHQLEEGSSQNLDQDLVLRDPNSASSARKKRKSRGADRKSIVSTITLAKKLYAPKSICVFSHWPLFSAFKTFLTELYRLSISNPHLPLERYVSNFVHEVPLPPPGRVKVDYFIGDRSFSIQRPPSNSMPLADVPFEHLFRCLNVENIVTLVSCLLMERKILFISSRISLLGNAAEAACSLLYPFYWQHVYIPVLPRSVDLGFLYAPVPFLMGVHPKYLSAVDIPTDVVQVDLDRNTIFVEDEDPKFPERSRQKILDKIAALLGPFVPNHPSLHDVDMAFPFAPPPDALEEMGQVAGPFPTNEVRRIFFGTFVRMFLKYRQFIRVEPSGNFRKEAFLKEVHDSDRAYVRAFMETQSFINFIEDRVSPSPHDTDVAFFDESIQAKLNRSALTFRKKETPFLNDKTTVISRTFVAPTPDTTRLPPGQAMWPYTHFPCLKPDLFNPPREVKPLVEEHEEDAQSIDLLASWKIILAALVTISNRPITKPDRKAHAQAKRLAPPAMVRKGSTASFASGMSASGAFPRTRGKRSAKSATESETASVSDVSEFHGHDGELSLHDAYAAAYDGSMAPHMDFSDPFHRSSALPSAASSLSRDDDPLTELSSQMGDSSESAVDFFECLEFDTKETCPACGRALDDYDIRIGWNIKDPNDYRTTCPAPKCNTKFVPRFGVRYQGRELLTVMDSPSPQKSEPTSRPGGGAHKRTASNQIFSPTGGSGSKAPPMKLEYLSPLLLKKEVENLLKKNVVADEKLFLEHPAIFWNLILHAREMKFHIALMLPQVEWSALVASMFGTDQSSKSQPSSPDPLAAAKSYIPPPRQFDQGSTLSGASSTADADVADLEDMEVHIDEGVVKSRATASMGGDEDEQIAMFSQKRRVTEFHLTDSPAKTEPDPAFATTTGLATQICTESDEESYSSANE